MKGQGFIAAGKLSMGDEIMNVSGGSYPVECIELEEKQEVVYNFQVEDYHTYYVGENSILVHNDCPEVKLLLRRVLVLNHKKFLILQIIIT